MTTSYEYMTFTKQTCISHVKSHNDFLGPLVQKGVVGLNSDASTYNRLSDRRLVDSNVYWCSYMFEACALLETSAPSSLSHAVSYQIGVLACQGSGPRLKDRSILLVYGTGSQCGLKDKSGH